MWPRQLLAGGLAASGALLLALTAGLLLFLAGGLVWAPEGTLGPWLPALAGSLELVGLALFVACVPGVGCGVYLAEYARGGAGSALVRRLVRTSARLPSVLYGVFGLIAFVGLLGLGPSAPAAGLTLGLLVLPGVIEATERALREVPGAQRDAARALGASRMQVVARVALPYALPRVLAGVLAAVSRVLGEVAPLMLTGVAVVGAGARPGLTGPFPALSFRLYVLCEEGTPHREAFAVALLLALLALAGSFVDLRLSRPKGVTP